MRAEGTYEEVKDQFPYDLIQFRDDGSAFFILKSRLLLWEVSLEEYEAAPDEVARGRADHAKRLLDRTAWMLGADRSEHVVIWLDRMKQHLPEPTSNHGRKP